MDFIDCIYFKDIATYFYVVTGKINKYHKFHEMNLINNLIKISINNYISTKYIFILLFVIQKCNTTARQLALFCSVFKQH